MFGTLPPRSRRLGGGLSSNIDRRPPDCGRRRGGLLSRSEPPPPRFERRGGGLSSKSELPPRRLGEGLSSQSDPPSRRSGEKLSSNSDPPPRRFGRGLSSKSESPKPLLPNSGGVLSLPRPERPRGSGPAPGGHPRLSQARRLSSQKKSLLIRSLFILRSSSNKRSCSSKMVSRRSGLPSRSPRRPPLGLESDGGKRLNMVWNGRVGSSRRMRGRGWASAGRKALNKYDTSLNVFETVDRDDQLLILARRLWEDVW